MKRVKYCGIRIAEDDCDHFVGFKATIVFFYFVQRSLILLMLYLTC